MSKPLRTISAAHKAGFPSADMLRLRKVRVTPARVLVLDAILKSPDELWDAGGIVRTFMQHGRRFNPTSAYRILRELEKADILRREWRPGHSGMKSGYRFKQSRHHAGVGHQLLCRVCGRIITMDDPVLLDQLLRLAERHQMDACNQPITLLMSCHTHGIL